MTDEMCSRFAAFGDAAVEEGGNILRDMLGNVRAVSKGRFDVVTEADYAVESRFAERLSQEFPDHQLVAEEGIEQNECSTQGFCWVLDPLDGTVNYAVGVPLFAVSLALLHDGQPQLAWVLDVCSGELFRARRGGGATLGGRPLEAKSPQGGVFPLGASSGFIGWLLSNDGASTLEEILQHFGKIRIYGSQALQLCYVASGRLLANVSREAKLWDDAAGALIASECGCRYTGLSGKDVFPLKEDSPLWRGQGIGSVAGGVSAHQKLLDLLEPLIRKTGS
jgi:myo-inositol-1(or 4)-monophosphatase